MVKLLAILLAGLLLSTTWPISTTASSAKGFEMQRPMQHPEPLRFAVISDPHIYNPRLGTSGQAFQEYLYQDPKLLVESEAIFDAALQAIVKQNVRFLIISGDLTKDGELIDHIAVAERLAKMEQHGIQVFVVPGNHDINNPQAFAYMGSTTRRVPNVSPQLFESIYYRFGYGQAIDRDRHSLSYLAEPVPGLWLLALDSCKYRENEQMGYPEISGQLSGPTMAWVLRKLREARAQGKQVMAFMHHGVNEHFIGESVLFPDYLVDDWANVSTQLANAGLKVIFTGHYHSQDAAYPLNENGEPVPTLCDVETGSLVLYPCAFRIVTLDCQGLLHIKSQRVTKINADTGGLPFQQYALQFASPLIETQVVYQLQLLFGLPVGQAESVAPLVEDALIANYAGDESPSEQTVETLKVLLADSSTEMQALGQMLSWLWTDLPPSDNELLLSLGSK